MANSMSRRGFLQTSAAATAAAMFTTSAQASEAPTGKGAQMKMGMNVLLWTSHLVEDQFPLLEKIKRVGYDGVELPLFGGEEPHFAMVGKEIKRLGLGCTCVTVMSPEANPVSRDAAIRKAAVERLKDRIRCTAAAGGEVLCGPMHSALGEFTGQGPTDDEKKYAADVIRAAADEAKAANVKLSVEFICRFECYAVTTCADAIAMVKAINHPSVGMLFDTFHANIEEKDPVKSLAEAMPLVNHVHISENDRGTPGAGHVAWEGIFGVLKKQNYSGWLTIEAFGRAMPEIAAATRVWRDFFPSQDSCCIDGLAFMKKMAARG